MLSQAILRDYLPAGGDCLATGMVGYNINWISIIDTDGIFMAVI